MNSHIWVVEVKTPTDKHFWVSGFDRTREDARALAIATRVLYPSRAAKVRVAKFVRLG